ncbi:MAG: right-handed parallel beta-helix repeat-containing protein, partial [Promethearchaeota archaeon]
MKSNLQILEGDNKIKFNIKKVLLLASLGIIFTLLLTNSTTYTSNEQENNEITIDMKEDLNLKRLKISGAYTEPFIHIEGNWSDAIGKGWFKGDGSWQNPYVIENVTIDATSSPMGSGIFINNSNNEYFVIRNCTVYNAVNGIILENTNKGILTGNTAYSNMIGIRLSNNCDNNIISVNNVNENDNNGIYISNNCDNNTISRNTANYNDWNGISILDNCDNNTISRNTANYNDWNGISILDN